MNRKKALARETWLDRDELFRMISWMVALAFCLMFWSVIAGATLRVFGQF